MNVYTNFGFFYVFVLYSSLEKKSISQSKHIYIAPYVANESELGARGPTDRQTDGRTKTAMRPVTT